MMDCNDFDEYDLLEAQFADQLEALDELEGNFYVWLSTSLPFFVYKPFVSMQLYRCAFCRSFFVSVSVEQLVVLTCFVIMV